MTQIVLACVAAMTICGIYTFFLPAYDWLLNRRRKASTSSPRSATSKPNPMVFDHANHAPG